MPGNSTRFKKGVSGNPLGRPKGAVEFSRRLRDEPAANAAEALAKAAKASEPWAVTLLLAYAWGRPTEMAIELSEVPDEELEAELARRIAGRTNPAVDGNAAGVEKH